MYKFFHIFPKIAFIASVGLFLACLGNDGYYLSGSDPRAWSPAWSLLLLGWIGLPSGTVAWLANPAMGAGWVLFASKRPGLAAAFSALALVLMLSFLLQRTVISSEAPTYSEISGYGLGYWLWVTSAGALLVGTIVAAMPTEFLSEARKNAP